MGSMQGNTKRTVAGLARRAFATMLALVLACGLVPAAAVAAPTGVQDGGTATDAQPFESTADGATAEQTTTVYLQAHSTAFRIVDHTDFATSDTVAAGIWVQVTGGAGASAEWYRIAAGADGKPAAGATAEMLGTSQPDADRPDVFYWYPGTDDTLPADAEYLYWAVVTSTAGATASNADDPIHVSTEAGYRTNTLYWPADLDIEQAKRNFIWSIEGKQDSNVIEGVTGDIRMGATLAGAVLKETSEAYRALSQAAATLDPSSPKKVDAAWQVAIADVDRDKAYRGSIQVTLNPKNAGIDLSALTQPITLLWLDADADTWSPVDLGTGHGLTFNDDGTISFLLSGTTAALGAFALVSAAQPEGGDPDDAVYTVKVEAVGVDADTLDETANLGGRVAPAETATYAVGSRPVYRFIPDPGFHVRSISLHYTDDAGNAAVQQLVHRTDGTGGGDALGAFEWEGNSYALPATWARDVTLRVVFERMPNVPVPPDDDPLTIRVNVGAGGIVYVGTQDAANAVKAAASPAVFSTADAGTNGRFVPQANQPVMLYFTPDGEANRVVKSLVINGESYVASTSYRIPALTEDLDMTVEFEDALPEPKPTFAVSAESGEHGRAHLGLDGQGNPQTTVQVAAGDAASYVVEPDAGYALASAQVFYRTNGAWVEGPDAASWMVGNTLTLADVTCDTKVHFTFQRAPMRVEVPAFTDRGGSVAPAGTIEVGEGGMLSITITEYDGYTLDPSSISLVGAAGSLAVVPTHDPKVDFDDAGNKVYRIEVSYDDLLTAFPNGECTLQGVTFAKDAPEQTIWHEVFARSNDRALGTVSLEADAIQDGHGQKVKDGGAATVYFFPAENAKLARVKVYAADAYKAQGDAAATLRDTAWSTPSYTLKNVTRDMVIVAVFETVDPTDPNGPSWTIPEDERYTITPSVEGDTSRGAISPAQAVQVPKGGAQVFSFIPASDDWVVGTVKVNGEAVASGVDSYTVEPTGDARDWSISVEFVERGSHGSTDPTDPDDPNKPGTTDPDDKKDPESIQTVTLAPRVELVEVAVNGDGEQAEVVGRADAADHIAVTPNPHKVPYGGTAVFYLRLTNPASGWTLHDVTATLPSGAAAQNISVEPVGQARAATGQNARDAVISPFASLPAAQAYRISIPDVKSDMVLSVQMRKVRTDAGEQVTPSAPLHRLTASSSGGGWVLPLVFAGAEPGLAMEAPAGEELQVHFRPFAGYYLKSVMRTDGTGSVARSTNVTGQVKNNTLTVIMGEENVHIEAVFAQVGVAGSVSVTWLGATDADGNEVSCELSPKVEGNSFVQGSSQTFVIRPIGDVHKDMVLDHVMVNGVRKEVIPGATFVTLAMDTDIELSAVFRALKPGEVPIDPPSHIVEVPDLGEIPGGSIVPGGPVEVIPGNDYEWGFKPDETGDDDNFEWILDKVIVDNQEIYPEVGEGPWEVTGGSEDGSKIEFTNKDTGETMIFDKENGTLTFPDIQGPHDLGAAFAKAVTVSVSAYDDFGTVSPKGSFKWKIEQGPVKVFVVPHDGYAVRTLMVNGTEAKDRLVESAEAAEVIGAVAGQATAEEGLFRAAPVVQAAPTHAFAIELGNPGDLPRTGKTVTVAAGFQKETAGPGDDVSQGEMFTLTAEVASGKGSISAASAKVAKGSDYTFNFQPDAGWQVVSVTDNGRQVAGYGATSYTVSNVQADHAIRVSFGAVAPGGSNGTVDRVVRRMSALAQTGDLATAGIVALAGVACAAVGAAVLATNCRRRRGQHE